jgi:argininosuccinate lyase
LLLSPPLFGILAALTAMNQNQSMWGGRFSESPTEQVKTFTESLSFDHRLAPYDIQGSIAHARMLAKIGVLTPRECRDIVKGLQGILSDINLLRFKWRSDLEDVHMNIEAELTRRVPAGGKLHTARSRNDQVALDLRLYLRDQIQNTKLKVQGLQRALVGLATRSLSAGNQNTRGKAGNSKLRLQVSSLSPVVIPGYTHLQRAQPVLAAHHLLAYVEMFQRDIERLDDCLKRVNVCPLGSGALAGSTVPIDREFVAKELGFAAVSQNSMDAVSDRDFVVEFCADAALMAMHVSRLAEDLILWASAEFGFITIDDAYTTGSSLMPQKKNPDIAELARGKTGRVYGNLLALLTVLKGLPLSYNRDLQEDKESLFDTVDTVHNTLAVLAAMLDNTSFNADRCLAAASDPALLATDLADYLVKKGVPFRDAHHAVGQLVALAEKKRKSLNKLTLAELCGVSGKFAKDALAVFDLQRALDARVDVVGAPSLAGVRAQLQKWKRKL